MRSPNRSDNSPDGSRRIQHDLAIKDFFKLPAGGPHQKIRSGQLAELPGHAEQLRRSPFLLLRRSQLCLQAARQLADQQTDAEHDGKCNQVLRIANGKRQSRRHKEEIKDQHAGDCGRDGWPAAHSRGDKRNAGQKDHHDIGVRQACRTSTPAEQARRSRRRPPP